MNYNFTHTLNMDSEELATQSGFDGSCDYVPDMMYRSVVSGILERMNDIQDTHIWAQVSSFCNILGSELLRIQQGIRLDPLYVDIDDDEAYFEWIFDDFRFRFSFRHDPKDSYWFRISLDPDGSSSRFRGDFNTGFTPAVRFALNYIERCA